MPSAPKEGAKTPVFVSSGPAGNEMPVGSLFCPPKCELSRTGYKWEALGMDVGGRREG